MAVESHAGWDMLKCYLFAAISQRETALRGSGPISAKRTTAILKYAKEIGEVQAFSMHSFRSRGAMSRALAGASFATSTQKDTEKSQDDVAVREAAGGRSIRLRGRRYGNEDIGDPVPRIQPVSAQRPEQVVGSLRKPTFTITKTNLVNPSASSMGWIRPSYASGRKCLGPDLKGQEVREGWNHQPREVRPLGLYHTTEEKNGL